MEPTLTHLNRINETNFSKIIRKMSLDADIVKLLNNTYNDSKKEFYEEKTAFAEKKRGKSLCFVETLNKSKRKIKEMEDMLEKNIGFQRNMNKVEYDRSLSFVLEIVNKKKFQN